MTHPLGNPPLPEVDAGVERAYDRMILGLAPDERDRQAFAEAVARGIDFCIAHSVMKQECSGIHALDDMVRTIPGLIVPRIAAAARESKRRRFLEPLHEPGSANNVMAICFLRDTWVRPHCHPRKETYYRVLSGHLAFMVFLDQAFPNRPIGIPVGPGESFVIKRGVTHSCLVLDESCCVVSGKKGRYIPEEERTCTDDRYPCDDEKDASGNWVVDTQRVAPLLGRWRSLVLGRGEC